MPCTTPLTRTPRGDRKIVRVSELPRVNYYTISWEIVRVSGEFHLSEFELPGF